MVTKRLLIFLVVGVTVLVHPIPSFALIHMSDCWMKRIFAQAGVIIDIVDLDFHQTIGEIKYTDTDGWRDGHEASGIVRDIEFLKQFRSIKDESKYGYHAKLKNGNTFGSYGVGIVSDDTILSQTAILDPNGNPVLDGSGNPTYITEKARVINPVDGTTANRAAGIDNTSGISPIVISVGKCEILSAAMNWNEGNNSNARSISGIVVGLPTMEIINHDTITIAFEMEGSVNGDSSLHPAGIVPDLIKIERRDALMAVLGGRVNVAAH